MVENAGEADMKKKNLWNWLQNVMFALFGFLCVGLLVSAAVSKGSVSFFGFRGFIVLTGSMSPTIEAGGFVLAKETTPQDIRVGDILTYRVDANTVLTHRVVEIYDEEGEYVFLTQGDANNTPDTKAVTQDRIIGKGIFWINGLGLVLVVLRRPQSILTIFILSCAVLLIPDAYRKVRKKADIFGTRDGSD